MVVEIISVGTELLLGNIINTNVSFLAEQCANLGLSCFFQSTVGDNVERIQGAMKQALSRADVVLLSGGIGEAEDDLTGSAAEAVYGRKQNFLIENRNGIANGMIFVENKKHMILMPGAPEELIPMFHENIAPYLRKLTPGLIVSQIVKVCGMSEDLTNTMVKDLLEKQSNPTLAPYAKTGEVHFRVTAKAESEKEAKKLIKPVVKELKERFGANIYTTSDDKNLEMAVVDLLKENELTLTTAESCTGGMLAARIINVPGTSEIYKEGFITYSNKAKRKYLGVKKSSLLKYGAVSEVVAKEMAKGGCFFTKADACVGITGIAGPDGGTDDKPVGLVYIGVCVCGETTVKEYHFLGERTKVREQAASAALTQLRECLLRYFSEVTFGDAEKKKKK